VKGLELANRLLTAVWKAMRRQTEAIQAHIHQFMEDARTLQDA